MIDRLMIVKCIELENEVRREHWRRDEDAFYQDFRGGLLPRIMARLLLPWPNPLRGHQKQSGPAAFGRSACHPCVSAGGQAARP